MDEKLPVFNIPLVERARDRIREFTDPLCGSPVTPGLLDAVVDSLSRLLSGVSRDALYESLRHILGGTLGPVDSLNLAWRLAGNLARLRKGLPVRPWAGQVEDEWVPLQLLAILPARNRRGRTGYQAGFRVLAGTSCPMTLWTFWPDGALRVISQEIGFSAPWGKYPFRRAMDLVGLRMVARVEARRSAQTPTFFQIKCPGGMETWNRERVLKLRYRQGRTCPEGYTHPCHSCTIGYLECPAGTHRETYVLQRCPVCQRDAYFDPERRVERCIDCDNRLRRQAPNQG